MSIIQCSRGRGIQAQATGTVAALDPEQMGVVWGLSLRRGGAPYPLGTPNKDPVSLADRSESTGPTDGLSKKQGFLYN